MIPKIIHYCWFGANPKPEIIETCIASWKKHCPDWEIVEWNENNWDIDRYAYARAAYDAKKWAFVSDVARLDILFSQGGVYLDTDVELLVDDPFAPYLAYETILCFENARGINTGQFFAAEKESEICRQFLSPYLSVTISEQTMLVNTKMNEPVIRQMLPGLRWDGKTQVFGRRYIMGCDEYGRMMKHYGTRSWADNLPKYRVSDDNRLKRLMRKPEIFEKLERSRIGKKILPLYTFLAYDLQDLGPWFFVKLNWNKRMAAITKRGRK